MLTNLLQNAVKYSPDGGQITLTLDRFNSYARIAVTDEGIGIPAEARPHLFTRFFRAGNVEGKDFGGMGIGLYLVKEIVTAHGGTVTVESSEGKGSTFTVLLPLAS